MTGHPGTPRFGVNPEMHTKTDDSDGTSDTKMQADGKFMELHYAYNPAMEARPMGTTLGGTPGKGYQVVPHQADYMSNHDGYDGGDQHLVNLDERKVLDNTIMSTKICFAEDEGTLAPYSSDERTA